MSMHPRLIVAQLALSCGFLLAQDNGSSAVADAPTAAPQNEMQKWIATTDEGWQAAFKRDVSDAHEAEVNKLKLQYLNLLEAAIAKASKATDLDGAIALRNEQKRFSDTQFFPEQDEEGDAALVKQARTALRMMMVQSEKNRAARAKALLAKYDAFLADAQVRLTKAQRLEDALLVKAKREAVAAAWGSPSSADGNRPATVAATQPASVPPVPPARPASAPKNLVVAGDPKAILVGLWRFSWDKNGWNAPRDFKADGTFIGTGNGQGTGTGKWEVNGTKIIVTYPDGGKDEMVLPLDPKGTKVIGKRGREMKAVKEK